MRILLAFVLAAAAFAQGRTVTDAEVMRVHRSALLIDTHNDVPSRTVAGFDIGPRASSGHTDLVRLREGGVAAVFFSVYVAAAYVNGSHSANRALQMIDTVRHDIVGRYPNDFMLALTADDIEAAHRQGKIAALMGLEGGHAIEDSLRLLRDYYRLGIRYMTLTHSNTNNWADSSGDMDMPDVPHHNGLTGLGKQVVREMNRLGMIVDISHVADKTFWDVLAVSSAPPFASHSSCRAFCNAPRDMTDDMIVALAKKGGVVQINFECSFLTQQARDAYVAKEKQPPALLPDVVKHIDHVVKIAGIDAVGIGSDFDGVDCIPTGLEDVSKFPNLTRALLEKGYAAEDIRKIYGGNTLRLMRAVEARRERDAAEARPRRNSMRAWPEQNVAEVREVAGARREADEAEKNRRDREAEEARRAQEAAEKNRRDREAEEARRAREAAEKNRRAREADEAQRVREAEQSRRAREAAEKNRRQREADEARRAREAEQARRAREADEARRRRDAK